MKWSLPLLACAFALTLLGSAEAGDIRMRPKAVLELFTSQGCSSCPDADQLLSKLQQRSDLIVLAYHVDYWDYIGWPDTFGSAANTDRQRAYAASWGSSRIYTPQLVVNGTTGVVGSHQSEVMDAIPGAALPVGIAITQSGEQLLVSIDPGSQQASAMVWLVTVRDHAEVKIANGENGGRTIDYAQIVTGRQMLGMWDPVNGTRLTLPASVVSKGGGTEAVVLLQAQKGDLPGPILGAAAAGL